jgi:hypothetical protein
MVLCFASGTTSQRGQGRLGQHSQSERAAGCSGLETSDPKVIGAAAHAGELSESGFKRFAWRCLKAKPGRTGPIAGPRVIIIAPTGGEIVASMRTFGAHLRRQRRRFVATRAGGVQLAIQAPLSRVRGGRRLCDYRGSVERISASVAGTANTP